jgi:hypothetical protein
LRAITTRGFHERKGTDAAGFTACEGSRLLIFLSLCPNFDTFSPQFQFTQKELFHTPCAGEEKRNR